MKRLLIVLGFTLTASSLWAWKTLEGTYAKCYRDQVLVYDGPGHVWTVSEDVCNVLTSTAGYHCTRCVAYDPK